MTWTLVRKELRQHWVILVLLGLMTMGGYSLILATSFISGESGSIFDSLRLFIMIIVVLGSLVLCHRLVVVEYAAKTQLFLEALPVSRWRMVAVKYALGLVVVLGIVGVALALACLIGRDREVLTPRFVLILVARSFSAALFFYNLFFLMGFLGRYRLSLYLCVFFGCFAINAMTDLKLGRFGPIALLDERFAFEGETFPWDALRITWLLSGIFLLLAFSLSLSREGSVAALLAEKMSHREKVFIASLLGGLVFSISMLDEKRKREPFDLSNAAAEERPGILVKVALNNPNETNAAHRLAESISDDLQSARAYLSLEEFPPVFITARRDLDASRFERGELEQASGVHVQANFTGKEFRRDDFSAWLLREVLIVQSDDRVKLEPRMWVLDGFALFHGKSGQAAEAISRDKALALRALYGIQGGFTPQDLSQWLRFRERVGSEIAAGVAWSGLKTLARRRGEKECQEFIRSVLGVTLPKDFRATLHQRGSPWQQLLKTHAGVDFESFWKQWMEELASVRGEMDAELKALPQLHGEITLVRLSEDSRQVRYRLSIQPPLSAETRYSFLHHQLPVFDEEVAPQDIRREQNHYLQHPSSELPESFTPGSRLYWTFSIEVPALGCPVISGWKRQEIK